MENKETNIEISEEKSRENRKQLKERKLLSGFMILCSVILLLTAGGFALTAGFSFDGINRWKKIELEKKLEKNKEIAVLLKNTSYLDRLSHYWDENGKFFRPVVQDSRNTLLVSDLSGGVELSFPFLSPGAGNDILEYSLEELSEFDVIYFVRPLVNTVERKEKLEKTVKELAGLGKKILIEPAPSKDFDIFGIHAVEEIRESEILFHVTTDAPEKLQRFDGEDHSYAGVFLSLYGLDQIYASFIQNEGALENPVFGIKKLEEGNVFFLGGGFRDYLTAVYMQKNGFRKIPKEILELDPFLKEFYIEMFEELGTDTEGDVTFLDETEPKQSFLIYHAAGIIIFSGTILLSFLIVRRRDAYGKMVRKILKRIRSFLDLEF